MAYTGFYVFGDSLVDSGNALKLAQWYGTLTFSDLPEGAPTASQGYFQGRFSNGYNFADLLSNKTIGVVTKPVFPFGYEDPWLGIPVDPFAGDPSGNNLNFAYGGAQIRHGDEVVPDFDGQTDAFKDAVDNHADPNALYLVTIGGNDVRSLAPTSHDPDSQADAHGALDAAADKMLHELIQLVDIGVHNVLITGVPDVGLIPKYDTSGNGVLDGAEIARAGAATEYSHYLDTLIRTEVVPTLQALGVKVTYVPIMSYTDANGNVVTGALDAVLPEIAALHGLTTAQLSENILSYQNLIFFDQVHPNAQTNALIGAYTYAKVTGTPWIERMPLTPGDIDYKLKATIGAAGEVDKLSFSLVAGTTYTFEMLGISSLGTPGSLADPTVRLIAPSGSVVASDADNGVGFDAVMTFTAATSGTYTLELSATGLLTGAYKVDGTVVGGAAMQAGNSYVVNSASTIVMEGAGGAGRDVVNTSVSYVLAPGSEIEVLRTTNDKGKVAINLTGNEFGQLIVGNAAANVLDGKSGADTLTGGAGKDRFVLSSDALISSANIDSITDYSAADIIDISKVLKVGVGTDVLEGGYARVTTSGLVQVDLDGGGNNWVTLSTINASTGLVTLRYLSGGVVTDASISRVSDGMSSTTVAMSLGQADSLMETSSVPFSDVDRVTPRFSGFGDWWSEHHQQPGDPAHIVDLLGFS